MTHFWSPWRTRHQSFPCGGLSGAGEGRGQTHPRRLVACAQGAAPYTHDNTDFDGSFWRPEPISFGHQARHVLQDSVRCEADVFHEIRSSVSRSGDENKTTGASAWVTKDGANPHPFGAKR